MTANEIKVLLIIGTLAIYGFGVWKIHDWYDSKKQLVVVTKTLDNRINNEKESNKLAKKNLDIQNKDQLKSETTNKAQSDEIISNKAAYDCVIPVDGVRIRNQAAVPNPR